MSLVHISSSVCVFALNFLLGCVEFLVCDCFSYITSEILLSPLGSFEFWELAILLFQTLFKKMHCFPGLVRNFIICSFVLFCWIFFLGFLQIPLSILFLLNNCFPGLAGNPKKFYNCCFDLFLGFFQFHYQVSFCWIISFYTITTFQEDSPICRYFGYNMK